MLILKIENILIAIFIVIATVISVVDARASGMPDLTQIDHVAPKGRAQDPKYNPHLPEVAQLIEAGPASIPYLISKLEDDTEVKQGAFDYWPRVAVGDVAIVLLVDFFTTADGQTSTIPGLAWDALLESSDRDTAAWDVLSEFIRVHGRTGLRRKVEGLLDLDRERYVWDPAALCFRPASMEQAADLPAPDDVRGVQD